MLSRRTPGWPSLGSRKPVLPQNTPLTPVREVGRPACDRDCFPTDYLEALLTAINPLLFLRGYAKDHLLAISHPPPQLLISRFNRSGSVKRLRLNQVIFKKKLLVKNFRTRTPRRSQGKMPLLEAHYHPLLFTMMTLSAVAELGLTSFLISAGNENGTWPSPRYHALLILFCFNAAWTTLFSTSYMLWYVDGASHLLANVASSVFWLFATSVLWGIAAGIMHNTRTGTNCARRATISRCRQSLTVEALGWTEFGLCVVTMVATCLWVISSGRPKLRTDLV